ncbi:MAG: SIR2 family protein [Rickettsiales bacterium]
MKQLLELLQPTFDESLVAKVDADGSTIIISDFEYTPAEVLKKTAEDQYQNLLGRWFYNDWLPERLEAYRVLLDIGDNKKRLSRLVEKIQKNECIPYIGSGMSAPSGLKTWADLLRSLCPTANIPDEVCDAHLNAAQYEALADLLYSRIPQPLFDEKLENRLNVAWDDIDGAIRYSPILFQDCPFILTSNFDDILEQLFNQFGIVLEQPLYGRNLIEFQTRKDGGRCFVVKIHGDYRQPHTRVLLKTEYDNFYSDASCCAELQRIFSTYSFLFLGCSLSADRTLEILKAAANSGARPPRHYAFLQKHDDFQDIENRLSEHSIFPIWYEGGHDDCIQALFVGILRDLGKI